jgi:hypothetical protein
MPDVNGAAMQDKTVLLEVDSRKRISLGTLATHPRYIAEVGDDDVITLTPAVVMPAATARKIDEFLDHPAFGAGRSRPVNEGSDDA